MKVAKWGGSLPEELVMEILRRLPVKTLLRFKCASKSWRNLIMSTEFVTLHLHGSLDRHSSVVLVRFRSGGVWFLASFDFDLPQSPLVLLDYPDIIKYPEHSRADNPPKIIGICNGVFCIVKDDEFVIYNPATCAYKQVPRPKSTCVISNDWFGYDCIADDFKIFSFFRPFASIYETYLYTLKDNSWLKIGCPPHIVPGSHINAAKNSLYWISLYNTGSGIIRFDLSSHIYEKISLPTQDISTKAVLQLGVLKGCIHILTLRSSTFDIWMLKEDNCWTQLFRCSEAEFSVKYLWYADLFKTHRGIHGSFPCAYSKNGRKIMLGIMQDPHRSRLKPRAWFKFWCHLESQTTSMVQVDSLPKDAESFIAAKWVESLVPPAS